MALSTNQKRHLIWLGITVISCELNLAIGSSSTTATIYVGRHFEVRSHDQPTKYVFNGTTRVAEVTGSLSNSVRIQRLRLHTGWNLCSLGVAATNFITQLQQIGGTFLNSVYLWSSGAKGYSAVSPGQSLSEGAVMWIRSPTEAVIGIVGAYTDPTSRHVDPGGDYIAGTGLEAWGITAPPGCDFWTFAGQSSQWEYQLTGALAPVSGLAPVLNPGTSLFVASDVPIGLQIPDPGLRIRYYHQDHVGSSSVVTDAQGQLVNENCYYAFGSPRNEYRLRQAEEFYSFCQKERDGENGLHYFEARFLAGTLSRFLSPDPKYAAPESLAARDLQRFLSTPQSINLYAYVQNNPLKYVDPSGLDGTALIIIGAGPEEISKGMDPSKEAFDKAVTGMFAQQTKGLRVTIKHVKSASEMTQLIRSGSWNTVAYFGHGFDNAEALDPGHNANAPLSKDDLASALQAANPKNVFLMGCVAGWTGLSRHLSAALPNATVGGTFEALDVKWEQGEDDKKNKINRMTANQGFSEYQGGFYMKGGKKADERPRERSDPLVMDPNAPIGSVQLLPVKQ
jgi:RHS repeat-associated protein